MNNQQKQTREILFEIISQIKPGLILTGREFAHFKEEMDFESMDLVELVARVEQHYRIHIPDEDFEKLTDIQTTEKYLKQIIGDNE